MIRTHRPRGYGWTCASLFQQTPDFRNINYESCLVDDESDVFTASERATKRQRIEKLADDFLNGHALHVPSARLPPQGVQHAVARSFARPKDARRAMAGFEVTKTAEAIWEHVDDQWEVLRAHNAACNGDDGDDDDEREMHMEAVESGIQDEEIIVEVHAQASCSSHRRQRTVRLAVGPSDEALRQAAALRNRTLLRRSGRLSAPSIQRAQSEAVVEETQEDTSRSSLQASVSDVGPTPTAAWTSSKWLNSGMFEPRHKAVDEECSKDELGLSSLPTPSQKAAARPAVVPRRGRSALSQQSTDATSSVNAPTGITLSSSHSEPRSSHRSGDQPEATAYVLVPPPELSEQDVAAATDEESQGDSQAQLLRRQGIRAAPRKSWASFGATAGSSADSRAPLGPATAKEGSAASSAIRESIQESASLTAAKAPRSKRNTKSTGAAQISAPASGVRRSSRRKSAPSESQAAANSTADLPIDQQRGMGSFRAGEKSYMSVAGKDSSPFLFRKRVSKFNNSDDPDIETLVIETKKRQPASKTQKRMDFPSDSPQAVKAKATPAPAIADPKTPLVNEHLNRLRPRTGTSSSRSSSLRKALRDEMRLAGAEFSHVEGATPSSQEEPIVSNEQQVNSPGDTNTETELVTEVPPEMPPPQMWPGTQVLLAEAQKDLFTSPNKENTTLYLGDKTTPQTTRDIPRRQPLQTLSQEHLPMPSTQALLDGWQGWSSIKKPRSATGKRTSLLPSPSVDRRSSNAGLIASDPVPYHSFDEAGLRKSSLRYSMSYNDSPDPQQTESLPVAAFFPGHRSELDRSTSSTTSHPSRNVVAHVPEEAQQRPRRPSGGIASSAAFSQGHPLSTTESLAVSSLSLHAGLSSANQPAPPQHRPDSSISFSPTLRSELAPSLQQQNSSISFSPVNRSELQKAPPLKEIVKPAPTASEPLRPGLASLLSNVQDSWSFSPLAQSTRDVNNDNQPESAIRRAWNDSTEFGTPGAAFPQAQDPAGDDASGTFLRNVDMDSQELDFTITDLVGDILGSARRGMPKGTGVFSQ